MQMQIQVLLIGRGAGEGAIEGSNTGSNIEMAKPSVFSGKASRVAGFIIVYKLFLKMKIREITIEEQI